MLLAKFVTFTITETTIFPLHSTGSLSCIVLLPLHVLLCFHLFSIYRSALKEHMLCISKTVICG